MRARPFGGLVGLLTLVVLGMRCNTLGPARQRAVPEARPGPGVLRTWGSNAFGTAPGTEARTEAPNLRGIVLSADLPMGGAEVVVADEDGILARTTTDQGGGFELSVGIAEFVVRAQRGEAGAEHWFRLENGEAPEFVVLELEAGHRLEVQVVDARLRPVAGAHVEIHQPERGCSSLAGAFSGPDGRAVIIARGPGPTTITCTHPDVGQVAVMRALPAGEVVQLLLPDGATIEGRIEGGGLPGHDARVVLGRHRGHLTTATRIGPDGRFRFRGVPPGDYDLRQEGAVCGTSTTVEVGGPGTTREVVLEVGDPHVISGEVIDAQGNPLEARVRAESEDEWRGVNASEDGHFERVLCGPGPFRVWASFSSGASTATVVHHRGDRPVHLRAPPFGALQIFLAWPGTNPRAAGQLRWLARTEPVEPGASSVLVAGLLPGRASMDLVVPGFEETRVEARIRSGETSSAFVSLRAVTPLVGRVLDPDGVPVFDQVDLRWIGDDGGYLDTEGPDADGRFAFPHLPEGPGRLRVSAPGFAPREIAVADRSRPLEIRLSAGVQRSIRVLHHGRPEPGVALSLEAQDLRAEALTDLAGWAHFDHLPEGRYQLTHDDFALDQRRRRLRPLVIGPEPELDLELETCAARVEVQRLESEGSVTAVLRHVGGVVDELTTWEGPAAQLTIDGVCPGPAELELDGHLGGAGAPRLLVVPERGAVTVTLP